MSAQQTATTTTNRPASTSRERGHALGTKVRTTFEPRKVLEVDDAELVDLHRQKLLHSFERSESTDRLKFGKSPNRWRGGEAESAKSGVVTDADQDDDDNADDEKGEGA